MNIDNIIQGWRNDMNQNNDEEEIHDQENEINENNHNNIFDDIPDEEWLIHNPFEIDSDGSNSSEESNDTDDGDVDNQWIFGNLFNSDDESSNFDSEDEHEREVEQRVCIRNFIETTVHHYSERMFQKHFRLQRAPAYHLIGQYEQTLFFVNNEPYPNTITHEKALLMTLWYLANLETFRQIADRFDVARSSAHRVLLNTLDFLCSLRETYIRWPHRQEEKVEISNQFFERQNIRGVIGAIDGCHIPILRPHEHHVDYYNRKKFYSVLLQGIVTDTKLFTDVYIGEPGSMHDARVLRRSPIYAEAYGDPHFFNGFFLIGDSAYPNLPWLLSPHRDNGMLDDDQREFNYRLSSTRVKVEHAFGNLKQRFRRLKTLHNRRLDVIIRCVMASCVLHNLIILNEEHEPENGQNEE